MHADSTSCSRVIGDIFFTWPFQRGQYIFLDPVISTGRQARPPSGLSLYLCSRFPEVTNNATSRPRMSCCQNAQSITHTRLAGCIIIMIPRKASTFPQTKIMNINTHTHTHTHSAACRLYRIRASIADPETEKEKDAYCVL